MYIKDEEFVEDYLNESLKIANHQLSYNKKIITVAKNIYEKIQSGGSILICETEVLLQILNILLQNL